MVTVAMQLGWAAAAATEEAEFQSLIRAAPPDAILLDLQLGSTDGIQQLHFLHSQGYSGAIVLMSGLDPRVLASAQHVGESLGLTIAGLLTKPARAAHVRDVLTAVEQSFLIVRPSGPHATPKPSNISVNDVARALATNQMELHLQPIVSAVGHEVSRAEALIRWRDPVQGLVPPDRFIPVAEQDPGLIDRLTMWVAETAAGQYRQLAAWGPPIQININISGRNLRAQDFPDQLAALLDRTAVPSGAIGLEITESVAMHDLDVTASVLTRLRLKGFPVALDDFGTGHSTLTTLRRMPFSAVKIDKSFVGELHTSSDSLTIVRTVIQMARDMHLASVAEGVGSADSVELLEELGIDGLQGHYFSQPLPFDGFAAWLREWR